MNVDYEIRVSLQDNRPEDCKNDNEPYNATVLAFDEGGNSWYNPCIAVEWGATPEIAFEKALAQFRKSRT